VDKPEILYHFTSCRHLPLILEAGFLKLTESNHNLNRLGMYPVVWLTDSYEVDGRKNGLNDDFTLSHGQDKTEIRFHIPIQPHFEKWSVWSRLTREMKKSHWDSLISAGNSWETYQQWWVSEKIIPLSEVVKIEHTKTGNVFSIHDKLPVLTKGAINLAQRT